MIEKRNRGLIALHYSNRPLYAMYLVNVMFLPLS